MLFSVIICRIWSFATAINKLLFDKNCHICNSYQKGAIFYQSHKVFYTTAHGGRHLPFFMDTRSGTCVIFFLFILPGTVFPQECRYVCLDSMQFFFISPEILVCFVLAVFPCGQFFFFCFEQFHGWQFSIFRAFLQYLPCSLI